MRLDVRLRVWLKGVDLVTSTAYLTLRDTMGYGGRLLGIRRVEFSSFDLACEDPATAVAALKRMVSTQSEFYNRNKHNRLLECHWNGGGREVQGTPLDGLLGGLVPYVSSGQQLDDSQEFDGKSPRDQVILAEVPIFRTEVLVEDREAFPKTALAQRLESELATTDVTVSALGTCWYLAVRSDSESSALAMTEEIVVSRSRNRGLLLNPNAQAFEIRSVEELRHE